MVKATKDLETPQQYPLPPRGQRILLVDNNLRFMCTCAKNLRLRGYEVLEADSLEEGRRILKDEHVHLAILDLRLRDDKDEFDETGLQLAKQTSSAVPKIILSIDRNWQRVREALSPTEGAASPALYFINKREGMSVLVDSIRRAFELHVRVNWDLKINWSEIDNHGLARRVEPGHEGDKLRASAAELEDLLRRLFLHEETVTLSPVLWQREGRVAFHVYTFVEGHIPEEQIVVCGRRGLVLEERQRFETFGPKAQGDTATTLNNTAETSNFAANAYSLAGAHREQVQPLLEAYRAGTERFVPALRVLCEKTLSDWSQKSSVIEESRTLDEVYRDHLALTTDPASRAEFDEKVSALIHHLPTLGVEVERADGHLTFKFDDESFKYPDPTAVMYRTFERVRPLTMMKTPGSFAGDTVLTDANKRTWVTDFACAGLAPLFWNYVELEAAIRFDWGEAASLQWIHQLERCLTSGNFTQLMMSDVESQLRKQFRAIHQVRLLAPRSVVKEPGPYHLAMLFQAIKRLSKLELSSQPVRGELLRPAHWLIAAAMLCQRVPAGVESKTPSGGEVERGVSFDSATHVARVNGVKVQLKDTHLKIFAYLYEHAGQLCTRAEIIENALENNIIPRRSITSTWQSTASGSHRGRPERPCVRADRARGGFHARAQS